MYIYFDTNGTIKEIVNDKSIRNGSNEANKIYCYLEGEPEIDDIWYLQKLPSGELSNEVSFKNSTITKAIPYDAKRDMKYFKDFEQYKFYVFTLNTFLTSQKGLNIATIRVSVDNTMWALGELTFNVQENVINVDNGITQSQYDYLLLAYASRTLNEQVGRNLNDLIDDKIEAKIGDLASGSPKVFDTEYNIEHMQDDEGIAVATDTGDIWVYNDTQREYQNTGLLYVGDISLYYTKTETDTLLNDKADKSDTYTKTEADDKFAPKSTAITHTGSQLQDYSGNNVYPKINQESIEDNSIVRNKEKYYQIEVNNLLNDDIFSLDKRVNYGWSGTLQAWTTYSDDRYTYMWIKIEYNKRYWGNPLAVWLFNSSQEYIATLDGIANVFKNFDIPDNSDIYYACIMYPSVTTNPIFRKTSVEIKDKIYDNGLFLKPDNFNIFTKCKRIQSYDEILDFSGVSTSNGVVALDDNKTYFSKNAKLCYATKTSGVSSYTVTKTARIENWKSMTFVFYIPYETWIGSTANSGYIQGYINGNVNYGWYFNGRYKWGWNFIKIRNSDIANAPTHVTSITITLNPRGSVSNGDNFGYITLDSVIFNMKMKPCVLLNFDHIYQESIDNGGYDLLFNNHIKFTLFAHGFTSLNANYKEIARKFIDELNCEIGSYGGANSNNTIINGDSYTLLQKYNDLMSLRSEFSEVFYDRNYSYATSQAKLTPKMEKAIMQSGFKYIRALSGLPMTYFDNNCNWIVHIEFSELTYNQIKKLIDDAIEYGDCLPLFTHGIANDADSQISSTSIPLSIMTQVVDYLHTKISNGEIECLTFDEFYHSCTD